MIKKLKNKSLVIILLFCSYFGISQPNTTEQLAVQYFQNKEFDKASELFEKLYNHKKEKSHSIPQKRNWKNCHKQKNQSQ